MYKLVNGEYLKQARVPDEEGFATSALGGLVTDDGLYRFPHMILPLCYMTLTSTIVISANFPILGNSYTLQEAFSLTLATSAK